MILDLPTDASYIPTMLLAIDIGNTDSVIGVFDNGQLLRNFRVASAINLTVDEAGLFVSSLFRHHIKVDPQKVDRVAICSVVPHLTDIYERMAASYFDASVLTISDHIKLPFQVKIDKPGEIGADRLANAAAGFDICKKSCIIVDIGTATTFDVVSDTGDYIGGVIAPGPQTAGANLAEKAARLFEVRIEKPDRVIGTNTAGALKSGLFYGTIGMTDYLIEKIKTEMAGDPDIIGTGGYAARFAEVSRFVQKIVPTLTLEGIRIISDHNLD